MEKNLLEFYRNGIRIYLDKEQIKYIAEPGKMTEERKKWLKENKNRVKNYIKQHILGVYSKALGEKIYFIADSEHAHLTPPKAVCYTLKELETLIEKWPEKRILKQVHQVKKELGDLGPLEKIPHQPEVV